VRDRDTGTVNRAGYACCVLDALRTRLRRRDIYATASTRWGDPRAELLAPANGRRNARPPATNSAWTPTRPRSPAS
jgi:hypothetical protein